jgi:hypothetical protein
VEHQNYVNASTASKTISTKDECFGSDLGYGTQLFLEARKLVPREKKIKIHKWSFDKQDASL